MLGLKYIPGVVIDLVTFQYGQELVFERALLMMFCFMDVCTVVLLKCHTIWRHCASKNIIKTLSLVCKGSFSVFL